MKWLKNQKGFTLVELLAVIVILGVIAAIAVPSIGTIIENSKTNALEQSKLMIKNAAELYLIENEVAEGETIDLADLQPAYLQAGVITDPVTGDPIEVTITVGAGNTVTVN